MIELLYGLSADHASKWPGILVFCRHLESCFEELLDHKFGIIWTILGQDSPSVAVDCWPWFFAVIETFQALQDDDPSIEKAYQRLLENAKSPHETKADQKIQVLRAMFAVLCWTSATLKPLLEDEGTAATAGGTNAGVVENSLLMAENSSQKHSSKDFRRPISKLFYSFRNHVGGAEESEHHPASCEIQGIEIESSGNDVLYQSSLNNSSLFTIGRVRLKWVDILTAHLIFDRSTRTLSVFRFPSFCAANILGTHNIKVLNKYVFGNSPFPISYLHQLHPCPGVPCRLVSISIADQN